MTECLRAASAIIKIILLLIIIHTVCYAGSSGVKCGIDNLVDTDFRLLKGKNIVLISHAAARAVSGMSTTELFSKRTDLHLLRVLAPEHGFYGIVTAGATVHDDTVEGMSVRSLYGSLRRPDQSMFEGADAAVLDLQDIGVRSYTYISTMKEVMEACAEFGVPLYILDRPNPLGGSIVDGSLPDSNMMSFVASIRVPYIHGMTIGELAGMINGEGWLSKNAAGVAKNCSLVVVRCKRWTRLMKWEDTELAWYPTSPNIPSIESVRGYAVTGLAGELGLTSIGIGTSTPFCLVGSPSFKRDSILERRLMRNGVVPRFGVFKPDRAKYAQQLCYGYYLAFNADSSFLPFQAAISLITTVYDTLKSNAKLDETALGNEDRTQMFVKAIGSGTYLDMLIGGSPYTNFIDKAQRDVESFKIRRQPYLLY
ncbi:MAG: DUF1343 domain-containing protein [Ignavibacteria bacterium]|nr:DUF1343 domain-containing protein [Ignavibacteria bacterium]